MIENRADYAEVLKNILINGLSFSSAKNDFKEKGFANMLFMTTFRNLSFIKTEVGSGLKKTIYISSKTKGRLVHLIELGFKHRSGKHVSAQPFMRPAYDTFTPEMLEDIKKIIERGGR